MWIDEGYLRQEGDAWSLAGDLAGVVADQCADVADGATGSAPAQEGLVLGIASGDRPIVRRGLVQELTDGERRGDVVSSLGELVRKDLIRPERGPGGDAFRFRHVLIMQAAYELLPKARRADLPPRCGGPADCRRRRSHSRIRRMHRRSPGAGGRYRAELGPIDDELRELRTRAGGRLAAAAARAFARADMPAAATLFGSAASLLDPNDPKRLTLLPDLGNAQIEVGKLEDAERTFEEAMIAGTRRGCCGWSRTPCCSGSSHSSGVLGWRGLLPLPSVRASSSHRARQRTTISSSSEDGAC